MEVTMDRKELYHLLWSGMSDQEQEHFKHNYDLFVLYLSDIRHIVD